MTVLKPQTMKMTVKDIKKAKKSLRFDLAIQRNVVWDDDRKSLLIHSLLYGYPIPPVFAVEEDGELWLLDGKQRITTVEEFVNDGFVLSENTPSVTVEIEGADGEYRQEECGIAGFQFSMLPKDVQDDILTAQFDFRIFKELSDEDRDEMFLRLNNGAALKPIELTRVLGGSKLMGFIQEVGEMPFFTNSVKMSASQKNRFQDEELILQIMALIHNGGKAVELGSKFLKDLASELKQDLNDELMAKIVQLTEYVGIAFEPSFHPIKGTPVYEKFMKKSNVPILFVMAERAIAKGIEPSQFAGWAREFFVVRNNKTGTDYNNASSSGSAKKENVNKRLEIMGADFEANVASAPVYVKPEPKLSKAEQKKLAELEQEKFEAQKKADEDAKAQANANRSNNPMWNENEPQVEGNAQGQPQQGQGQPEGQQVGV